MSQLEYRIVLSGCFFASLTWISIAFGYNTSSGENHLHHLPWIFDIPSLISYVSKAIPWRAGDVLVTGTPGGVGFKRKPPIFMKEGDKVEVEISEIGILSNIIKDEKI